MRKERVVILLFLAFSAVMYAQNSTVSPYSRFGYGEMYDQIPGAYRGMGGVALGMRNSRVINAANPAAISTCDSMTFMFDLGASAMWANYSDAVGKRNRANGNLEYLTLELPIWSPYIAFSAGVLPYSAVGYDYTLTDSIGKDYHYETSYYGAGGFTEVYAGLGINLFDWVSLGANIYYMFGSITNTRMVSFTESPSMVSELRTLRANDIRLRYGMQFFHTFGKHSFVLGGVYENPSNFNCSYSVVETTTNDTVPATGGFTLPRVYGGGLSYTYDNRLTLAADVLFTDWATTTYEGATDVLRSKMQISAGAEYRHRPGGRKYYENMMFRVGAQVSDSYIKNINAKDLTVSVGLGFPLRNSATVINTTIEYNHRGAYTVLQENSLKLTINASISETWFFKRRL